MKPSLHDTLNLENTLPNKMCTGSHCIPVLNKISVVFDTYIAELFFMNILVATLTVKVEISWNKLTSIYTGS